MDTNEINIWWCLGCTTGANTASSAGTYGKCTAIDAIGIWAVILFYTTVITVSVLHSALQRQYDNSSNNHVYNATRIRSYNNNHRTTSNTSNAVDDMKILCGLIVYFFTFIAGCLVWVIGGIQYVQLPIYCWQIQIFGLIMLLASTILFIMVHLDLGRNWSPVPELSSHHDHQLITQRGLYKYARHPMYAIFTWACLATLLATSFNLVITWCVFGFTAFTLCRIETEERILINMYGNQYLIYQQRVSVLDPVLSWCCCCNCFMGLDNNNREMNMTLSSEDNNNNGTIIQGEYRYDSIDE